MNGSSTDILLRGRQPLQSCARRARRRRRPSSRHVRWLCREGVKMSAPQCAGQAFNLAGVVPHSDTPCSGCSRLCAEDGGATVSEAPVQCACRPAEPQPLGLMRLRSKQCREEASRCPRPRRSGGARGERSLSSYDRAPFATRVKRLPPLPPTRVVSGGGRATRPPQPLGAIDNPVARRPMARRCMSSSPGRPDSASRV